MPGPIAVVLRLQAAGKAFWRRWHFSWALANLKFVFLESKAVVDWKKVDP